MAKYSYESLNLDRPAIRLLHLHRGGDNSEISCNLFQAELNQRNDTISYEALSYTWGLPGLTEKIIVDGCHLDVTYNLHQALQRLRYLDEDRILWIDAICIDQGNPTEQGHQVANMSKIYSEAERVIFWLGPGTVETDMLIESLQLFESESTDYNFGNWSLQDDHWKNLWASMEPLFEEFHRHFRIFQRQGLRELLARPWFRRVWILQEVALAKAGIIVCDRQSVSARLFCLLPLFLEIKPDTHCQFVLDIMPSPWRKTSWWSKSPDLRALLVNFGDSEATKPRDLVYALRGISSDASGKDDIKPDYDKSEEDLVREVVQFVEHCELEDLASKTTPRSVRDLIKCLRDLDLDRCMVLAETSKPHDMAIFLERSKIRINQDIFTRAVACDGTGDVVEILLRYCQEHFILSNTVLLAAAKNSKGAKGIFEALLRDQGDKVNISDEVLIAAAGNEQCGSWIFKAILHNQGDKVNISDKVLIAAAGNKQCGSGIFKALFSYQGDEISYQGDKINILDEVLISAAGNTGCGSEIFKTLLWYQGDKTTISDEVLISAAGNTGCGSRIFEALFSYQGDKINISDEVLISAAGNTGCGSKIFEALLYSREIKPTSWPRSLQRLRSGISEALLHYQGDKVNILDKVL